jgi:streptomycin 3"-adenylyltransferase
VTNLPAGVEDYLELLTIRVHDALGADVVGVYLHGSGVMGGFNPRRSDLDVLIVSRRPLTDEQRSALCAQLDPRTLPVPAAMLELSVVTRQACLHPVAAPAYELHVNTRDGRCADGRGRTDPDLLLHFAVVRQVGRLLGPGLARDECIAPVPLSLVLEGMAKELRDAANDPRSTPEYILLNACRNLAFLRTGRIHSKVAGGRWVLENQPDELDVAAAGMALARQEGQEEPGSSAALERPRASRFAASVAALLEAERQGGGT